MPFGIGIWEILILLVVLLLVFGRSGFPRWVVSSERMREFKESVSGKDDDDTAHELPAAPDEHDVEEPERERESVS